LEKRENFRNYPGRITPEKDTLKFVVYQLVENVLFWKKIKDLFALFCQFSNSRFFCL
jgi:hypothetical protein